MNLLDVHLCDYCSKKYDKCDASSADIIYGEWIGDTPFENNILACNCFKKKVEKCVEED